mgnify:CR=1 FL=1
MEEVRISKDEKLYKYKVSEDNIWENLYLTIVFSLN